MKKKMKHYDAGGDVYTGDDPIVKYRMGMTDKEEPTNSRDFDASETTVPSMDLPAAKAMPTPTKKEVGKAITKAAKEEKAESKPAPAPTKQQKAGPTMIRGAKSTGTDLKSALFGGSSESPRMKAAKRDRAMDASNYSMKSGGKVGSASKRADGCAIRGKTRA
jgi:hypothetical protein